MYKRTSPFPTINYLISLLLVAWVAWRTYHIFTGTYKVLSYILFACSFDLIAGIQVLLLALSMGKSDRNPDIDYGHTVIFNKIMLVLFVIYLVVFHVVLIMEVINYFF